MYCSVYTHICTLDINQNLLYAVFCQIELHALAVQAMHFIKRLKHMYIWKCKKPISASKYLFTAKLKLIFYRYHTENLCLYRTGIGKRRHIASSGVNVCLLNRTLVKSPNIKPCSRPTNSTSGTSS